MPASLCAWPHEGGAGAQVRRLRHAIPDRSPRLETASRPRAPLLPPPAFPEGAIATVAPASRHPTFQAHFRHHSRYHPPPPPRHLHLAAVLSGQCASTPPLPRGYLVGVAASTPRSFPVRCCLCTASCSGVSGIVVARAVWHLCLSASLSLRAGPGRGGAPWCLGGSRRAFVDFLSLVLHGCGCGSSLSPLLPSLSPLPVAYRVRPTG